jgi:hypothetical protein
MTDRFNSRAEGLTAPARHGFAITPADGADLGELTRALYVGGAGNITLVMASGAELLLSGVPAGSLLPLRVRRVKATGTTATALVGLA